MNIRRVCVYCGSSPGLSGDFVAAAREMGSLLARRKIGVVYGGATIGLMGAVADAALAEGGEVIGVIPRVFSDKVAHPGLTQLHVVETMHERKALMFDLADAFVALPGGIGTLEEILEVLTWAQIGLHAKPCAVLNVSGYFDPLLAMIERAVKEEFVRPKHRGLLVVEEQGEALLARLETYQPPKVTKWLDRKAPPPDVTSRDM